MVYFRVSIKGTIGATEVWSVNPQFATSTILVPSQSNMQDAANLIAAVNVPSGLNVAKSTAAMVTSITVEARTDAGQLAATAQAAFSGTQTGGSTPYGPPQSSVVLSLRSDTPGARGRGRLYWPALGLSPTYGSGRLTTAQQSSIGSAAVTYLRAIQDALKAGIEPPLSAATFELAVFSKVSGGHSLINRILVGDVLDTQRRRRDALPENYVTQAFPGA